MGHVNVLAATRTLVPVRDPTTTTMLQCDDLFLFPELCTRGTAEMLMKEKNTEPVDDATQVTHFLVATSLLKLMDLQGLQN